MPKIILNENGKPIIVGSGVLTKEDTPEMDPIYWKQYSTLSYIPVIMPVKIKNTNIVSSTQQGTEGLEVTLNA